MTGNEIEYINQAHSMGQLAGDGFFTAKCTQWLEKNTSCKKALLTHSCTAALEMAAILAGIKPGDEIIMPSYTFVSTANAFVLRGGIPVFVDIRPDTLNLNEKLIEQAITPATKAIVVVHYAGVGCEMNAIETIAGKYNLLVIEDAAHGVMASYRGRQLGSIGDLGCYSFHETKNLISGQGGALLINNSEFIDRAINIRDKGTNRSHFINGKVDKYSWVDIGSSYLPGEIIAAFLWAQMEEAESITVKRINVWDQYHYRLEMLENNGLIKRPFIPSSCNHNAHIYYVLLKEGIDRNRFIKKMSKLAVNCVFHYVPLHNSLAIRNLNLPITKSTLQVTEDVSARLVRLPLWVGVKESIDIIIQAFEEAITT